MGGALESTESRSCFIISSDTSYVGASEAGGVVQRRRSAKMEILTLATQTQRSSKKKNLPETRKKPYLISNQLIQDFLGLYSRL